MAVRKVNDEIGTPTELEKLKKEEAEEKARKEMLEKEEEKKRMEKEAAEIKEPVVKVTIHKVNQKPTGRPVSEVCFYQKLSHNDHCRRPFRLQGKIEKN